MDGAQKNNHTILAKCANCLLKFTQIALQSVSAGTIRDVLNATYTQRRYATHTVSGKAKPLKSSAISDVTLPCVRSIQTDKHLLFNFFVPLTLQAQIFIFKTN